MLTVTRNRPRVGAAWALAVVLGLPALAQAQLFPNQQIKRERVPCCQEDPVYGIYRRQYYGYFPTCWRRFPPGWGCPSPEAPNSYTAMEEIRREIERSAAEAGPIEPEAEPGMESPLPDEAPERPPGERTIPLPGEGPSPFDIPPRGGEAAPTPPATLPPPGGGPRAELDLAPLGDGAGDGPPPMVMPGGLHPSAELPGALPHSAPALAEGTGFLPSQAPRRTTLIGGMLDNLRSRRR
jgi:hypothetical protein